MVVDPTTSNTPYVTQDGTFSVNSAGYLVTANGDYVQGYTTYNTTTNTGSNPGNLQIISPTANNPMTSYTIDSQGVITMTLADGTTAVAGQVVLQDFADPQMLVSQGNNLYSNMANAGPTTTTGVAPGSNGLGTIKAGALESSNVDLSNEMANLITAQRAFEANSKIISTSNEVLQTLVQMKQS